jgi:hypothetical protein
MSWIFPTTFLPTRTVVLGVTLTVSRLSVPINGCLIGPSFVEDEVSGMIETFMQRVLDAARFLEYRRNQRE